MAILMVGALVVIWATVLVNQTQGRGTDCDAGMSIGHPSRRYQRTQEYRDKRDMDGSVA